MGTSDTVLQDNGEQWCGDFECDGCCEDPDCGGYPFGDFDG